MEVTLRTRSMRHYVMNIDMFHMTIYVHRDTIYVHRDTIYVHRDTMIVIATICDY